MRTAHTKLDEEFRAFHAANPDVYTELVRLARKAKAKGKTRLSMRMLWEALRYNLTLAIEGDGEYRLNNNHVARYARLVVEQEPDLAGLFELRGVKVDDEDSLESYYDWLKAG
jgi:hypothetical protein